MEIEPEVAPDVSGQPGVAAFDFAERRIAFARSWGRARRKTAFGRVHGRRGAARWGRKGHAAPSGSIAAATALFPQAVLAAARAAPSTFLYIGDISTTESKQNAHPDRKPHFFQKFQIMFFCLAFYVYVYCLTICLRLIRHARYRSAAHRKAPSRQKDRPPNPGNGHPGQ